MSTDSYSQRLRLSLMQRMESMITIVNVHKQAQMETQRMAADPFILSVCVNVIIYTMLNFDVYKRTRKRWTS